MVLTHVHALSDFYRTLALALYRPDEELISPGYLQTVKELASRLDLDVAGPMQALEDFYAGDELSLTDLEVEYSRLFVGPFSLPVPPYESCFREKGKVMGDTTMAVAHFYQKGGFEVEREIKEPPDHIALELSFLAELCALESKFAEQENTSLTESAKAMQRDFLANHLLAWAEAFQEAVQQKAILIFYPAMAKIMVEAAKTHFKLNQQKPLT